MLTHPRLFALGFGGALLLFLLINLGVAQLRSDCGLMGLLELAGCSDDISRAGFPLVVWEEGGFAYRNSFNGMALLLDLAFGLGVSVAAGFAGQRLLKNSSGK